MLFYALTGREKFKMWPTWLFLILTILCWGSAPILEKYGLKEADEITALTLRYIAIFFVLLFVNIFTGNFSSLSKVSSKTILAFSGSGLLAGILGMWAYFKILKINPSSKIVPLTATFPLVTVILSIFLLKENVTWQRILGTILIISGVFLVK